MLVAVTGATGFVGAALCDRLVLENYSVKAIIRERGALQCESDNSLVHIAVGGIGASTDWSAALDNVDCVIHCAARAYVMDETEAGELTAYHEVNAAGTRRLAEQAAEAGVRRLIYLSSIKVHGEQTRSGVPFMFSDAVIPKNPYGVSKLEAEQTLWEVSAKTGLGVVIVRPPLVYGPGVKGNFLALLRWLDHGVPLPLGAIYNCRSLVGLDNLIDLIITCLNHCAAANQTFLVSDGEDLSTTELLQRLGNALGRPTRLVSVPPVLLKVGASILGKKEMAQRLLENLLVDISQTKERLGWSPPVSVDGGLRKTAQWYLRQR